ncbi:MAG: Crp/Fnr family transcriptional regulator [Betaproteobacteria bacterium]|nr:Crp/Fnr family transcriptional regulator [Betaproteobacteria bacterium]
MADTAQTAPDEIAAVAFGSQPSVAEANFFSSLAQLGVQQAFARGELLIREGGTDDDVYLIQSGNVRVYASDDNGKQVVIDEYGPGDFVGEMALDGTRRSASVAAVDAVTATRVSRDDLRKYLAANPDFALGVIVELSRRAKLATRNLKNLALKDVYGRLQDLLYGMVVEQGGRRVIPGRLNKSDLARRIGASRDMVTLIMRDLEAGGYLVADEEGMAIARPLPARW